jgi:DNA-binding HxlR family transcriptional regulator
MSRTRYPQFCALARAAEIIGERWTLLVIRELLLGPMRFGDLSERLSGVSPTLLAARLDDLVANRVVRRTTLPPPFNAQVYELTETGRAIHPAIRELIRWGGQFLFPIHDDDAFEPDWALLALDAIARRTPTQACRIGLRVLHRDKCAEFVVQGGPAGTQIAKGGVPSGAVIEARFDTLLRVLSKELSIDAATSTGQAKIGGAARTLRKLPQLFDLARADRPRRKG